MLRAGLTEGDAVGDKDGGGLGALFQKAEKWLRDQGVTKEDLAKAKADSERWEAEAAEARDTEAREDRQRRAGTSHVTLRGVVEGTADSGLAVQTEREGGSLSVTVECVDPVPLRGGSFVGLSFVIPRYTGPGTYDLGTMDVTGQIYELSLDGVDSEGFYWAPDYGPGVVTVSAGEASADVRFTYQDPGSNRIELEGVLDLS
jgi:hypothetical protein